MTLKEQQMWSINRRNFQVGNIVLLKDDFHNRNQWPNAHIMETSDKNGNVRDMRLKVQTKLNTTNMMLEPPMSRLVIILETSNTRKNIDSLTRNHHLPRS